jgi:hypothetical protein
MQNIITQFLKNFLLFLLIKRKKIFSHYKSGNKLLHRYLMVIFIPKHLGKRQFPLEFHLFYFIIIIISFITKFKHLSK